MITSKIRELWKTIDVSDEYRDRYDANRKLTDIDSLWDDMVEFVEGSGCACFDACGRRWTDAPCEFCSLITRIKELTGK
jgi:hypothetical protein